MDDNVPAVAHADTGETSVHGQRGPSAHGSPGPAANDPQDPSGHGQRGATDHGRAGREVRITPALAFAAVGAVLAAYILQRVFVLAHRTVGWVVACSVVALVIDPVVQWLARRLPRVIAVMITIIALIVVAVAVVARLVSELTSSAKALAQVAPTAAARLEERSSVARNLRVTETIRSFTKELTNDINQETLTRVKAAPTYLVTGILMLFLLAHGRRYLNGALAQIRDENRRDRLRNVLRIGLTRGRTRLLLSVLQVIVVTLVGLAVFEVIRLRASFILAFLIGLASLMPFVGMVIAGIPAGIMAYGLHGVSAVVVVVVFVFAMQAIDLFFWRPRCNRRTLETGLFLPLVATLVGYRLYNVGGAVYGYALVVLALALLAAANFDGDTDQATWAGEVEVEV